MSRIRTYISVSFTYINSTFPYFIFSIFFAPHSVAPAARQAFANASMTARPGCRAVASESRCARRCDYSPVRIDPRKNLFRSAILARSFEWLVGGGDKKKK
ncbi:hypothetical protein PUN28_007601 [Cardiocondyla obscurior]|uniref:Secreted protein n=1 Tax=Cardiocondyla obscurior TaxID=286306 RepID=A0AAW2G996_9HYME